MADDVMNMGGPYYGGWDPNKQKTPPQWQGTPITQGLLDQFLSQLGPSQQFNQAWDAGQNALNMGGGFSALKQFMPSVGQAGQYVGGGQKAANAYEDAQTKRLQQTGMAALRDISGKHGAGGTLGSTGMGIDKMDLAQRYNTERSGIASNAAQLGESIKQGRMNTLMGSLGTLGNLASYEQMNAGNIAGNMMNAANQSQQMGQQGLFQGLMAQQGLESAPNQYGMDIWSTIMGKPKTPSVLDYLFGGAGALAAGGYF